MQCSSCGKTFKRKVRLVKHEHVCVDFGFVRKKALAKKNDDDPESDDSSNLKSNGLKCKYCGTKFCWESNLKKHKKEMFECELCGNFFCTGKLAKAHFNSKHRNIECLDCGQLFNRKQHLILHTKMKIPKPLQ